MAQQSAVEWLIEELMPSISLQTKYIDELKDQAKQMETNNTRYACGLAISKLIYQQAINTQMSDEEIEKQAELYYLETEHRTPTCKKHFINACKWYREQLKGKI